MLTNRKTDTQIQDEIIAKKETTRERQRERERKRDTERDRDRQ
jgi:hypothetical protein